MCALGKEQVSTTDRAQEPLPPHPAPPPPTCLPGTGCTWGKITMCLSVHSLALMEPGDTCGLGPHEMPPLSLFQERLSRKPVVLHCRGGSNSVVQRRAV
jgi:hypothetical protein